MVQSGGSKTNHQHSWSKSETNLSGKSNSDRIGSVDGAEGAGAGAMDGAGSFKMSVFGVVSLNDLQETDEAPFSHSAGRQMNDLSKYHPTLNNISNEEICIKSGMEAADVRLRLKK